MSISVQCECGARLKAPEELAGTTARCPKCKQRVPIPRPKNEEDDIDLSDPLFSSPIDDLFNEAATAPPPTPVNVPTPRPVSVPMPVEQPNRKEKPEEHDNYYLSLDPWSRTVLLLGGGSAVVICLVLSVAAALIWVIPGANEMFGMGLLITIITIVGLSLGGSMLCAVFAMMEMWSNGHEMVVLYLAAGCVFGVGMPAAYVCGWLFDCNQKLMVIWSVLIIPTGMLVLLGTCLNCVLPEVG